MAFPDTTIWAGHPGIAMLTGILIGAGIMLTYLAIGVLAGRRIRNLGRELAKQDQQNTNPPLN
jgi:multisubunit Na+/H+ antiporter MnhB subunit